MPLPLELGRIRDEWARRALERLGLQFPIQPANIDTGAIMDSARLRIVAGLIGSSNTIVFQYGGFTLTHNATGKWTIDLTTPFASANYLVLSSPYSGASGNSTSLNRSDVTRTASQFGIFTIDAAAFADLTFAFACIGPR